MLISDHIVLYDIGCSAVIIDLVPVPELVGHGERHTVGYLADGLISRAGTGANVHIINTRTVLNSQQPEEKELFHAERPFVRPMFSLFFPLAHDTIASERRKEWPICAVSRK